MKIKPVVRPKKTMIIFSPRPAALPLVLLGLFLAGQISGKCSDASTIFNAFSTGVKIAEQQQQQDEANAAAQQAANDAAQQAQAQADAMAAQQKAQSDAIAQQQIDVANQQVLNRGAYLFDDAEYGSLSLVLCNGYVKYQHTDPLHFNALAFTGIKTVFTTREQVAISVLATQPHNNWKMVLFNENGVVLNTAAMKVEQEDPGQVGKSEEQKQQELDYRIEELQHDITGAQYEGLSDAEIADKKRQLKQLEAKKPRLGFGISFSPAKNNVLPPGQYIVGAYIGDSLLKKVSFTITGDAQEPGQPQPVKAALPKGAYQFQDNQCGLVTIATCNFFQNFEGDNILHCPDDFAGLKNYFSSKEKITVLLVAGVNLSGYGVKIWNGNGDLVYSGVSSNVSNGLSYTVNPNTTNALAPSSYIAAFYHDATLIKRISFVVTE